MYGYTPTEVRLHVPFGVTKGQGSAGRMAPAPDHHKHTHAQSARTGILHPRPTSAVHRWFASTYQMQATVLVSLTQETGGRWETRHDLLPW